MNCTDSSIVLPLTYALQDMALWSYLVNIACVVLGMLLASASRSMAALIDFAIESRRIED